MKKVMEAVTKDVEYVKGLLAKQELISPDGSPYAHCRVVTRQGIKYIVLLTEKQEEQGDKAGAIGLVALATIISGGALSSYTTTSSCASESLITSASLYSESIANSPDLENDITSLKLSIADGETLDITVDSATLLLPNVPGGVGIAKNAVGKKFLEKGAKEVVEGAGKVAKYWDEAIEFGGIKVFKRNDIIDQSHVDKMGRTNLQIMQQGVAPIGTDGKSVNLHHMTQTNDSAIAGLHKHSINKIVK